MGQWKAGPGPAFLLRPEHDGRDEHRGAWLCMPVTDGLPTLVALSCKLPLSRSDGLSGTGTSGQACYRLIGVNSAGVIRLFLCPIR